MEFSLCLLFAKLVSYTFLYWLPLYIANVGKNPISNTLVKRKMFKTIKESEAEDCFLSQHISIPNMLVTCLHCLMLVELWVST